MAASTSTARRAIVAFSLLTAAVVVFAVIYYAFASDEVLDDSGLMAYFEEGAGLPVEVPAASVPPGIDVMNLVVAETERGLRVVGRVRNTSERVLAEVDIYVDLRATSGTDAVETVVAESLRPVAPGGTGLLDAAVTSEAVAAGVLRRIDAR